MILEKILAALERLNANLEAGAAAEPKKTRAQKAVETAPAAAAAVAAAAVAAAQSEPAPLQSAPVVQTAPPGPATAPVAAVPAGDMKELSPLITQLAKTRRDDAVAILKSFGAANARELKPEHIAPAIEKFKTALAAPAASTGSDLV
jgi:hypothetical protein